MLDPQEKAEQAKALFMKGYNCSQSLCSAFCDETGINEKTMMQLSGGLGGGIGGLRNVCGAVSGMALILSILRGYSEPSDAEGKKHLYAMIQEAAAEFRNKHNSIICRDILESCGIKPEAMPAPRTSEYYAKRPCPGCIASAAFILAEQLNKK